MCFSPVSKMIDGAASDYAQYFNADIAKEFGPVVETIEDMLTRLEEFESLVDMVQTKGSDCVKTTVPEILAQKGALQTLTERVEALEMFVSRVHHDLDIVEAQMDVAETDVGASEGTLKNILKPLFFKKTDPAVSKNTKSPSYESPNIFSTNEFFGPEDEPDGN